MLASFGSLPVTLAPFARTPLHASGNQLQSQSCCAPYFAAEKLASLVPFGPFFPTQPMSGIVTIGSAPFAFAFATKSSKAAPGAPVPGMLSKYQSLPRLSPFCFQLWRVVEFPPQRLSGALSAASCAASAKETP